VRRTSCGACGYDDLELFLDLGQSPVADAYTSSRSELSTTYPLQLAVCTGCWLVQLLDVVEHDVLFGTGYSFYSSASTPLSLYHERYAEDVLRDYGELAKRLTVEIGCNDGDMLRHFADAECLAVGVDPAEGPAWKAIERRGIKVLIQPFGRHIAERIRDEHGPAGVVIANHVLAHVESVADVLDGVQHLLAEDGVVFIEVQYLSDLLVNNAFDLVYHEHRNFFSLSSLEAAVERWGLHVHDVQLTDRQGGSLRVVLGRDRRESATRDHVLAQEEWLRRVETYVGFAGRTHRIRERLRDLLSQAPEPVVGYGAPAKATTLLNFCGIDDRHLTRVLDTTIAKQGRFVPGVRLPIVSPGDVDLAEVGTFLLLAWNYAPQIIRKHLDYTAGGGRWLLPFAAPVLL